MPTRALLPAVLAAALGALATALAAPPAGPPAAAPAGGPAATPPAASAALAALADLVARLEADPATDWRRVDLEAARRHLADLERVTLRAEVAAEDVPGGVVLRVGGEDPATVAAIQRLLPERAARLGQARRWRVATAALARGLQVEIRSLDPREAGRIRALGLTGLLVAVPLDDAYLLGVARGEPPAGRAAR